MMRYKVLLNGQKVADNMNLDTAMILLKALIIEYFNNSDIEVSIRKIEEGINAES